MSSHPMIPPRESGTSPPEPTKYDYDLDMRCFFFLFFSYILYVSPEDVNSQFLIGLETSLHISFIYCYFF